MTASTTASPRQTRASPVSTPAPTGQSQLEAAVARLRENARKFTRLSLDERAQLARSMQAGYLRSPGPASRPPAPPRESLSAAPLEGEEWTLGPWFVVRQLRLIRQSLLALKHTGNTPVGQGRPHRGPAARGAGVPRGHHRRDAVSGSPGRRAPAVRNHRGGDG